LLARDDDEEATRDYNIWGLQQVEKNKSKKHRGRSKKKESRRAAATPGASFVVDVASDRFAPVLDGQNANFGIDRTDPLYRDTL